MEQPSWLFGTIHQICKEDLVFGKEAEAALERSQVVCFENDFTAFENPEAAKVIEETAPLPQDYLSVEDYAEVRDFMRSRFNIDSGEFSKMKLIQIYTTLNEKALGCDSVVSTEYYLLQKAKANGQTIKGLESAGRAMAVLNESHAKRIAGSIMHYVNDFEAQRDGYKSLVTLYKTGKLSRFKSSPGRNETWIPVMQELMNRKSAFFAFGAFHLYGRKGVIRLLEKAGYRVEPVE